MSKILQARLLTTALLSAGIFNLASAQSSSVVVIGTVPTTQVQQGLGFNLNPGQEWQWQAAAAAGATHARFQCSWSVVEQQTPAPENKAEATRYVEDANCAKGFGYAKKYGIHPTVVAAYGPPFHPIVEVTVPQGAAKGATSFEVEFAQGFGGDTLANLKFPYDYFCPASSSGGCTSQISSMHSYQGTLIAGITAIDSTHAKIQLASALTTALPASSTPYVVNEILYPSAATESETDPSVVAYGDFVEFLANDMASYGVTGDIEIWNEPPWKNDPWDFRAGLYDAGLYSGSSQFWANFGFVTNLEHRIFPKGITATWGGTDTSGSNSVLDSRMLTYSGQKFAEPATTVTAEAAHPYGGLYANPEESMWVSSCLAGTAAATSQPANNPMSNGMKCELPGVSNTSNMMFPTQLSMKQKLIDPSYGVSHAITETNELPPTTGLQLQQSKAVMRQFLGFEADGLSPIEFFALYAGGAPDPSFSFVQQVGSTSNYVGNPDYTALSDLMTDLSPISRAAVQSYSAEDLPSVKTYTGTYALATTSFVGSRGGAKANSIAYFVWQVSACVTSNNCWYYLKTPAAAPVTVNIPSGMKVTSVVNTITRALIAHSISGDTLSFAATDEPIEVILDPTSYNSTLSSSTTNGMAVTTLTLKTSAPTTTYGEQVTLIATLKPNATKTQNTNGLSVSFFSGSSLLGTAPLASGVATLTTSTLPYGTNALGASFSGNASFFASSAVASVSVARAVPTLTLPTVAGKTTTSAAFTVTASSNSPGAMHFAVLSGPARVASMSGQTGTIVIQGAGTVVLQVAQNQSGSYAAGTVQTSFTVAAAQAPGLAFDTVATQTYGSAPLAITAESKSPAAITYSLIGGPATLSGRTLTLTGKGTVIVQASQPTVDGYLAAATRMSITVQGKTPTLTLPTVASKTTTSAAFTVTASSNSPGAMHFAVLSGPARVASIDGQTGTIVIQGAGTVVLQVAQNPSGNYAGGTVQTSFTVAAAQAPGLAFDTIATQTYGSAPLAITAKSKSPAAITYSLVDGPATLSGKMLTLTGKGTVIVQASQPTVDGYLAAATRMSITVQGKTPTLTLPTVAGKTTTSAAFTVTASSNSPGAMHFAVLSGPARVASIDGQTGTIVIQGAGTVVLQVAQNPSGNYAGGTVQTSFTVAAAQ